MDKEGLLRKIDCVSFMLIDLGLYLDTHPSDAKAAEIYRSYRKERKELLQKFAQNFYPLTMDCCCETETAGQPSALDRASNQGSCSCSWCWGNGSEPWKGCCEPASKA